MDQLEDFYNQHRHCQYLYPKIDNGESKIKQITGNARLPYLKLSINGPWKDILSEVKKIDHMFVPHRDDGQTKGWSSLCLHGLGWDKTDTPYMYPEFRDIPESQLPWSWTSIAEQCPIAHDYFKNSFPYQSYMRLRFMKLAPGGYIGVHRDSTSYMLAAVNISLNNPRGCEMVLENVGVVPFEDSGSVMAFNNSYQHIVWNQGDEPRYHMIVHGIQKWPWEKIVSSSYDLAYEKCPNDSKQ